MPSWIVALLIGISLTAWSYAKLARLNGNAVPRNNFIGAVALGLIAFIVVLSFSKLVLNY